MQYPAEVRTGPSRSAICRPRLPSSSHLCRPLRPRIIRPLPCTARAQLGTFASPAVIKPCGVRRTRAEGCRLPASSVTVGDQSGRASAVYGKEDDDAENGGPLSRLKGWLVELAADPGVRLCFQLGQIAASLLFVVLYVWSTYSAPCHSSWRYKLDISLCVLFALDYVFRVLGADNKLRAFLSFWNLLDLFAVFPPLLEWALLCLHYSGFSLGRFDFRWFKILRALRVMRVSLLAGEIRSVKLSSGALLSGAASIRLYQLVASVLSLLFTTSSIVVLVERIPFHEALYFVTTTLTTVGFGDVVAVSPVGKFTVLAMILVGVVLIPVQTSQLYAQLTARRVTLGSVPDGKAPTVLVSTQLSDVRGFADFFTEFFQALKKSSMPTATRMVGLCNRPNYEFRAFQEMNEPRLTLMEGSVLSERDLVRSRAEAAHACLLLADRFSSNARQEDISIQFQVWALKGYTKRVPLYVQVLLTSSRVMVQPFLDPDQDVVVSVEQTRHRLLALSCLCPGASTLIANLLRRSAVARTRKRTLAGRRWMRAYVNGCAHKVFSANINVSLAGVPFAEAAEWMHRTSGCILIGALRDGEVVLNPGRRLLRGTETVVVIGPSQREVDAAAAAAFVPLKMNLPDAVRNGASFLPPPALDLAFGVAREVDGEVQCVPMEDAQSHYPVDSESVDFVSEQSVSLDHEEAYCVLPDTASAAANHPSPSSMESEGSDAARAGDAAPPLYSSPDGSAAGMGAFLEGFREPLGGPSLVSSSYDSEEEDAGETEEEEVGATLTYAGVAHRNWYGGISPDLNGAGPSNGTSGGTSRGGKVAINAGWTLPRSQELSETASEATPSGPPAIPPGMQNGHNGHHLAGNNGPIPAAVVVEPAVGYVDDDKYFEQEPVKGQGADASVEDGGPAPVTEAAGSEVASLTDHVILCGAEESFLPFLEELRRCDPFPTPVVILHPRRPVESWAGLSANGPLHFVKGEPCSGESLRAVRSKHARALVYLTGNQRPQQSQASREEGARSGQAPEQSRVAVLADAQALLTCYGVGEHGGALLPHAVVELCYTSSVRFLQPGLLLMGVGMGEDAAEAARYAGPRKSWLMRKRQEMAAVREGLSEWQANPYYCAGRVTVPAVMDTFACHSFFNKGLMVELLEELAGDDNMPGGALLHQINVPPHLVGRPYRDLVMFLTLTQYLVPLGLYRRKSENRSSRLHYVVTNPPAEELLEPGDRVFVLRERGVATMPVREPFGPMPW